MSHPPLRPLAFGEILDGAFQLYRRHFSAFFLAALLPYVPAIAVYLLVAVGIAAVGGGGGVAEVASLLAGMVTTPLTLGAFFLSTAALTYMTARTYRGAPVSVEEGLRNGLARFWHVVGAVMLTFALGAIGLLLFVVPGIIVYCMLFAVVPAVVVERQGPTDALRRSRDLARGALMRIFLVLLVGWIIAMLPPMVLGMGSVFALAAWVDPASAHWLTFSSQVGQQILGALALPFSVGVTVLLYYDRRVRAEALDVQVAAERLPVAV